jgi:signal transduction histidine kinase
MFEIAKILATQQDLENMLQELLSCLVGVFQSAETGVLLTYDPLDDRLTVRGVQGYDITSLEPLRIAPGESISGVVFQTGQARLYPTPQKIAEARASLTPIDREIVSAATQGPNQPSSIICTPLITGQEKIGVLALENRTRSNSFNTADLQFLEYIADLIALAVQNARLREELQTAQALYEGNRLKAELISTLAHEMRTPLTSIKGYATALLLEETTFRPETQHEFLQIIDEESDALEGLIHDLLESSIIDAGLLRLEPQPVMLPRLAHGVIESLVHRAKNQHFLVDFPKPFPIVDADPRRIEQVLRNLLDNAIKYSERGLVVVRGEVTEDEIVISVADQGVGIAPEHLNRLFEKGFRVKSGLGRHVIGSGLGLPIARTIVESHGGRIWAESQVGQGTTLYFTIPLGKLDQAPPEPEGAAV